MNSILKEQEGLIKYWGLIKSLAEWIVGSKISLAALFALTQKD